MLPVSMSTRAHGGDGGTETPSPTVPRRGRQDAILPRVRARSFHPAQAAATQVPASGTQVDPRACWVFVGDPATDVGWPSVHATRLGEQGPDPVSPGLLRTGPPVFGCGPLRRSGGQVSRLSRRCMPEQPHDGAKEARVPGATRAAPLTHTQRRCAQVGHKEAAESCLSVYTTTSRPPHAPPPPSPRCGNA